MKVYIQMDLYTINVKFNFPLDFGYTCDVIGQRLPHLSRFIPDTCFVASSKNADLLGSVGL